MTTPAGSLLLHVCCGPCALHPVRVLQARGVAVTGFFFNPNIQPLQEYLRRRAAMAQAAEALALPMRWEDAAHPSRFLLALAGEHGPERCLTCYRLRLERLAQAAREGGHAAISTTLLYSRYQRHQDIRDMGQAIAAAHGLAFLYEDFRAGWQAGVDASRELGLYRQPYCGCVFSEYERYEKQYRAVAG